ncbi:putative transporter small subunit [Pusillimonas sp. SM2304]|nr:putative transporter small subunit [Pusillimonas sp. SM2304]MDS1139149.1 putative transporter small subunit [Pusillimonas sp. SM2304]
MLLTGYILVWPVISAAVLLALIVALIRDMRAAHKEGGGMI